MATNHTANYQLNQWEATDQVLRTDFNEDNTKVDAALAGLAAVDQQHEAKMNQLNQQLSLRGNCQIYFSSYVGTGENYSTLSFPHKPILLCVMDPENCYLVTALYGVTEVYSRYGSGARIVKLEWSGNSVTWTGNEDPNAQCNVKGKTYFAMALLDLNQ